MPSTPDPTPSSVAFDGLTRSFGATTVLHGVGLEIAENSFHCLLGPSGCGKTTLLRILAGLDLPDAGTVTIGGRDHTRTPAHRRPTNLVFQNGALFPHMSVQQNVAFGLRNDKVASAEVQRRVGETLDLVAMAEYADRMPATLSGGQRQRVAIARSLVKRPDVLLLDEPLSALDLALQLHMRRELKRWQAETGTTFVCVTHNQAEAMEMADQISVMRAGHIEQTGSSQELYTSPRTRFVAEFIGENNVFDLSADGTADGVRFGADLSRTVAVRPESLQLLGYEDTDARGAVTVATVGFTGRTVRAGLLTETDRELLAELPAGTEVTPGQRFGLGFADADVVQIPETP